MRRLLRWLVSVKAAIIALILVSSIFISYWIVFETALSLCRLWSLVLLMVSWKQSIEYRLFAGYIFKRLKLLILVKLIL